MPPTSPDWTRARIRYELAQAGHTNLSDLSRRHETQPQTVSNAINEPHRLGEEIIAAALGKAAAEIWPSRYDHKGERLNPQPRSNYKQVSRGRDSQKRTAA